MDRDNIRDYNQGIMEFGAIQCTPKNPYCLHCPLEESCVALKEGKTASLPIKLKKTKVRNRYFNYLVPVSVNKKGEKHTVLHQRINKGIWQNLWQFPLLETPSDVVLKDIGSSFDKIIELNNYPKITLFNVRPIVHKLSHQHLHTKFWILETNEDLMGGIPIAQLEDYPVPVLIADFMNAFKF